MKVWQDQIIQCILLKFYSISLHICKGWWMFFLKMCVLQTFSQISGVLLSQLLWWCLSRNLDFCFQGWESSGLAEKISVSPSHKVLNLPILAHLLKVGGINIIVINWMHECLTDFYCKKTKFYSQLSQNQPTGTRHTLHLSLLSVW